MRNCECSKCGADISDTYQSAEDDVGVGAGWYCDACDLAIGDEDGYQPHDDDVQIFGSGYADAHSGGCEHCGTPLEAGYGLAGGGMGPYMYCPNEHCKKPTFLKTQDQS